MADEKKDDKKEEKPLATPGQVLFEIFAVVMVVLFISQFVRGGEGSWFTFGFRDFFYENSFGVSLRAFFELALVFIKILCAFLFLASAYAAFRTYEVGKEWRKKLYPEPIATVEMPKNEKWQRVIEHVGSDAPSDWRLAILEADIILDDLLNRLGYIGDTIGEKLKKAKTGDFASLNAAWEAHRVRNVIAHEGQDFTLTQREALRVIGLYETVFREFDYI